MSAFDEQPCRRRLDSGFRVQGTNQTRLLLGDPKYFSAGGHNPCRRGLSEDCFDQVGRGIEHMLAIIKHQQPDPALQGGGHRLAHALARLLGHAQIAATASGTAAGSETAASSKTQIPSGNSSASRVATSNARRRLANPPTPVRVTNRCALTAASTS